MPGSFAACQEDKAYVDSWQQHSLDTYKPPKISPLAPKIPPSTHYIAKYPPVLIIKLKCNNILPCMPHIYAWFT